MTAVRLSDAAGTPVPSRRNDRGTLAGSPTDASGTTPKVFFPKNFLRRAEGQDEKIVWCTLIIGRLSISGDK